MLRIRLSRMGRKNAPTYRLVVSERHKDTLGDAKELLGHYNPRSKEMGLKADRIKYWLSVGAQPSSTVHNLLVAQGIIEGKKVSSSRLTKKRNAKLEEKRAAEAEAKKQAEEEAKAKAEAEKQAALEAEEAAKAEEAPATEEVVEEKPADDAKEETPAEEKKEETA